MKHSKTIVEDFHLHRGWGPAVWILWSPAWLLALGCIGALWIGMSPQSKIFKWSSPQWILMGQVFVALFGIVFVWTILQGLFGRDRIRLFRDGRLECCYQLLFCFSTQVYRSTEIDSFLVLRDGSTEPFGSKSRSNRIPTFALVLLTRDGQHHKIARKNISEAKLNEVSESLERRRSQS